MSILVDSEAELSILGSFFIKQDRIDVFQKLNKKYFATEPAKSIFLDIKDCLENDLEVNLLNLKSSYDDLLQAISRSNFASIESSFSSVVRAYMAREAQTMGLKLVNYIKTSEEAQAIVEYLGVLLTDYNNKNITTETTFLMADIIPQLFTETKKETYLYNFNILGLEEVAVKPSNLVSVVARTKSGKTSFLTQVSIDLLNKNKSVLFCSLEVNQLEIGTKILACEANVNPLAISNYGQKEQSENNNRAIIQATKNLENKKLEIYHKAECYIAELRSKIIEFCKNNENSVVFIDQLQFVRSGKNFKSKIEEYDYIMQELKVIANKTNSIIFLAHQLNRDIERRDGKFPQTSDIKDCGRIEEISDLVLMFAKSSVEKDENRYCTIVSRHIHGGKVILNWNIKKARFQTISDL